MNIHMLAHSHHSANMAHWLQKRPRPRWILLLFLSILLINITASALRAWNIKRHGVSINGIIRNIANCKLGRSSGSNIVYTVQYVDTAHKFHTLTTTWCDNPGKYHVGDRFTIIFDPNNVYDILTPEDLTSVDRNLDLALFGDGLTVLLVCLWALLIRHWSNQVYTRPYSHHPLARRVRYARYG